MAELKILRIVSELDFGGVEKMLEFTLPQLTQTEGVKLKVLVLGKGGRVAEKLTCEGLDITILDRNPRIPNFRLVFEVMSFCKDFNPNVIHCQGAEANFHGIIGSYLGKVPVRIAEEIGIPNHHTYWKYIFRVVYKMATTVLAVSESVEATLLELKEVPYGKTEIFYNPVPQYSSSVSSRVDKEIRFITVCRLVPIKNLSALIKCFSKILKRNDQIRLWIVGDGPEGDSLKKLTDEVGVGEKVVFFGFLADVFSKLIEADIFVLPSLSEGSPVSLAEAMSCGLPSIVTQVGGAKEILGASQSGWLIDPQDPTSIQFAMQQMLDLSAEERLAMGERAREEAKQFSVEKYIEELMKVYRNSEFS